MLEDRIEPYRNLSVNIIKTITNLGNVKIEAVRYFIVLNII